MSRVKANHNFDERAPLLHRPNSLPESRYDQYINFASGPVAPSWNTFRKGRQEYRVKIKKKKAGAKLDKGLLTPPSSSSSSHAGRDVRAQEDGSEVGKTPSIQTRLHTPSPLRSPSPLRLDDEEADISIEANEEEDHVEKHPRRNLYNRVVHSFQSAFGPREARVFLFVGVLVCSWLVYLVAKLFLLARHR